MQEKIDQGSVEEGFGKLIVFSDGHGKQGELNDDKSDGKVELAEPPKEGMVFPIIEDVVRLYNKYAYGVGFEIISCSLYKRDDGVTWKYKYACVRQGWSISKGKYKLTKQSCCGCAAGLTAQLSNDIKWHLTKVQLEHNHKVGPSKSRFYHCNRSISTATKRRLDLNDTVGILVAKSYMAEFVLAGGIENLTYSERDLHNHLNESRRLRLGIGDAEAIF
ncbi:hypothetical protein Scep_009420 [Stephania cephalantha]|uniref:FAR1 domain-containing protein n=1 Tax=Stephania cephalantha TaxID=152367 RepID=A0AAP0JTT8_9MAGN